MSINIGIITVLISIGLIYFLVYTCKRTKDEDNVFSLCICILPLIIALSIYSTYSILHPKNNMIKLNELIVFENRHDPRIDDIQRKYSELLKLKVAEAN